MKNKLDKYQMYETNIDNKNVVRSNFNVDKSDKKNLICKLFGHKVFSIGTLETVNLKPKSFSSSYYCKRCGKKL